MYVPKVFAGPEALGWQLADEESFGLVIANGEVTPLPFLVDAERRALRAHAARSNPICALDGARVSVAFSGPHGYVTPRWYAEPRAQVPTWNYAVACAHGTLRVLDRDDTRAVIAESCARFEPEGGYDPSWIPRELHDGLLEGIVGLEIAIDRMEVKLKLSQNRAPEDRRRVREGFVAQGQAALAAWMERVEARAHWDTVYEARGAEAVSWFQPSPDRSLALIERAGVAKDAAILDVGGGASRLAGALLERGYRDVSVLDISERALAKARERLGHRGHEVQWITADVTEATLERRYALWHDRAVFHFLVGEDDRRRYRELLRRSTSPGAAILVATFALDGPERCSGLPIVRYSPESLLAALGPGLTLVESETEDHHTPAGKVQRFVYCRFRRDG